MHHYTYVLGKLKTKPEKKKSFFYRIKVQGKFTSDTKSMKIEYRILKGKYNRYRLQGCLQSKSLIQKTTYCYWGATKRIYCV